METKTFGQVLKQIRVAEANIGLRKFAEMIDMQPSNFSDIERGKKSPPADRAKIDLICDTLGLPQNDPRRTELFDLAADDNKRIPADIVKAIKAQTGVPVLVRTVANKQLTDDELKKLAKFIEEHY